MVRYIIEQVLNDGRDQWRIERQVVGEHSFFIRMLFDSAGTAGQYVDRLISLELIQDELE